MKMMTQRKKNQNFVGYTWPATESWAGFLFLSVVDGIVEWFHVDMVGSMCWYVEWFNMMLIWWFHVDIGMVQCDYWMVNGHVDIGMPWNEINYINTWVVIIYIISCLLVFD